MSATHIASRTAGLSVPTGYIRGFITRYSSALQEWRARRKLRAALYDLGDAALRDIGISRGDIEHVVSNRTVEPRGAAAR
jgi:uncharacterized protein YjiS (DUF1127 family)